MNGNGWLRSVAVTAAGTLLVAVIVGLIGMYADAQSTSEQLRRVDRRGQRNAECCRQFEKRRSADKERWRYMREQIDSINRKLDEMMERQSR